MIDAALDLNPGPAMCFSPVWLSDAMGVRDMHPAQTGSVIVLQEVNGEGSAE